MKDVIRSVVSVSDGIMVSFEGGLNCYYSTAFLREHAGEGTNVVFLNYDPSDIPLTAHQPAASALFAASSDSAPS